MTNNQDYFDKLQDKAGKQYNKDYPDEDKRPWYRKAVDAAIDVSDKITNSPTGREYREVKASGLWDVPNPSTGNKGDVTNLKKRKWFHQ